MSDQNEYAWLTTAPNPRSRNTGYDAGQRGWRVHLVKKTDLKQFTEGGRIYAKALCGLYPVHGWGSDLFINEPCARCDAKADKLGIGSPPLPKN